MERQAFPVDKTACGADTAMVSDAPYHLAHLLQTRRSTIFPVAVTSASLDRARRRTPYEPDARACAPVEPGARGGVIRAAGPGVSAGSAHALRQPAPAAFDQRHRP